MYYVCMYVCMYVCLFSHIMYHVYYMHKLLVAHAQFLIGLVVFYSTTLFSSFCSIEIAGERC